MNKHSLLNSLLLASCLAVSGWIGQKTAENSERLAGLQPAVDAIKEGTRKVEQSTGDSLARLERRLDDMVPRREFDAKILNIELRMREMDLELLKLKQGKR